MTAGFVYAIVLLGVPALVLAAGVAACLRDHDDATRALSVPFAYACVVTCGVVAVRLGLRGETLTLGTLGPALLAGGVLLLRRGRRGLPLWPLIGSGITLLILASPYRWLGPGVLGWNVGNDSVVHVTYADALAMPDRAPIAGSSAYGVVHSFANGYPEGSHALLASVLAFSRDPLTTFNPVLAVMMAFAAFPAYWLIRRQLASAPLAGIGAAAAAAGYLQFGYYSQGFMPQLAVTALLFGALALGYEALASRLAGPGGDGAGVTAAACRARLLGRRRRVPRAGRGPRRRRAGPAARAFPCAAHRAPCRGARGRLPRHPPALDPHAPARADGRVGGRRSRSLHQRDRGNLPGPVDPLTMLGMLDRAGLPRAVPLHPPDARRRWSPPRRSPSLAVLVALLAQAARPARHPRRGGRRRRSTSSSTSSIYYTAKTYQVAAFRSPAPSLPGPLR